jgi:hypothetical protein
MTLQAEIPRTIHIVIKTIDGDKDEFKFKQTALVAAAKKEALDRFGIDPPPGETYRLAEKKGDNFRVLDDNKTLGQEGVDNKETIWLGTEQQVG